MRIYKPRGKGRDRRVLIGRAAACWRCSGRAGLFTGCACLVDCGHPKCTGEPVPDVVPLDYGRNTPQHPHPEGYRAPRYTGPRGRA